MDGQIAWHITAWNGDKVILKLLWCWGREVHLNLIDSFLLSKDVVGQTAWHLAVWCDYKEILEELWCLKREVQLDLKGDLLLAKDDC